jgi:DNA-binding CsgD family transcriptional regulator
VRPIQGRIVPKGCRIVLATADKVERWWASTMVATAATVEPKAALMELTVALLESPTNPSLFPARQVFSLVCEQLDATGAVYQRVDWMSGESKIVLHGYAPAWVPRLQYATRTLRHQHPLLTAAAAGDLRPNTAQQAAGGARAWQRSPSRHFLSGMLSRPQMVSVGLRGSSKEVVGLAFGRTGQDFSRGQVTYLTEVQPLLQALHAHVTRLQAWQASLLEPSASAPAPVAVADAGLTGREMEVLLLLAQGLTATAAAHRLSCSPRTVQHHTASIFRKLEVNDRLSAVLEAQQRGILPVPQSPCARCHTVGT